MSVANIDFDEDLEIVYSEKAENFCEISYLLLSTVHTNKSKVEISQNFVAFSEYMNFTIPHFHPKDTQLRDTLS